MLFLVNTIHYQGSILEVNQTIDMLFYIGYAEVFITLIENLGMLF